MTTCDRCAVSSRVELLIIEEGRTYCWSCHLYWKAVKAADEAKVIRFRIPKSLDRNPLGAA